MFCLWTTDHFGHHCPDAQCYGCDEFGHFAQDCPHKIPSSGHNTTTADLIQGIYTSTSGETDHTPITVPDIGDISAGHSPTLIPTMTEAAVLEGIPYCSSSTHHSSLSCPSADGCSCYPYAMIPTDIVTLHPTLTTSPVGATHATPWTRASLTPATPATPHKDLSPRKSSNAQDT